MTNWILNGECGQYRSNWPTTNGLRVWKLLRSSVCFTSMNSQIAYT